MEVYRCKFVDSLYMRLLRYTAIDLRYIVHKKPVLFDFGSHGVQCDTDI